MYTLPYQKTTRLKNKLINGVKILCLLLIISCVNTEKIVGEYKRIDSYDKCIVDLRANNTYLYNCYSHMSGERWSYGLWNVKKNIIYFTPKLLYDTIRLKNKDTLVISDNHTPELFNQKDIEEYNNLMYLAKSQIGLFSQNINYIFPQKKLIRKENRLYQLNDEGKISVVYFSK